MSKKVNVPIIESSLSNPIIAIPSWLNSDFIAFHLKKYFNDEELRIVRFDVRPATDNGFSSRMYCINVIFTQNSDNNNITDHSFVIKIPVFGEAALAARLEYNLYKKEIEFYTQIAPKISALLAQLNETKQLFADCYGVCLTNDAVLLEDLTTKSYCVPSTVHCGFNLDEAKIALKKMAAFHAINTILQQQQPNIFENFKFGLLSRHSSANDEFFLTQFDAMAEAISAWPNSSQYVPKLRRLRSKLLERICKAFDPEPHQFNTLIHGDLYVDFNLFVLLYRTID